MYIAYKKKWSLDRIKFLQSPLRANHSYYTGSRGWFLKTHKYGRIIHQCPKTLHHGDTDECFKHFEICSKANKREDAAKALKPQTLLEGEVVTIWLELSKEVQGRYEDTKEVIKARMRPMGFVLLDKFHRRLLRPGEALSVFVHSMRKLLLQAMPTFDDSTRD